MSFAAFRSVLDHVLGVVDGRSVTNFHCFLHTEDIDFVPSRRHIFVFWRLFGVCVCGYRVFAGHVWPGGWARDSVVDGIGVGFTVRRGSPSGIHFWVATVILVSLSYKWLISPHLRW